MTRGYVLEVRIGVAEPPTIALVPGTPLDPTSFGRSAMWRIGAEGVLDIHGYVYFDGRSLFVQSADEQFPVLVNRHRVPMAWTEIRAPSTLHVGQAQIDLKVTDTLARSGALVAIRRGSGPPRPPRPAAPVIAPFPAPDPQLAGGPPAPIAPQGPWDGSSVTDSSSLGPPVTSPPISGPGGAPFARGAFVPQGDGESTRFAPLEPVRGSSGRVVMDDPRAGHTSPVVPVPLAASSAAPVPKPNSLWSRAKADWFATSLPKRILFVLSPLVVLSYFSLLFGDDDDKASARVLANASASAASAGPALTAPPSPTLRATGVGLDGARSGVATAALPTAPAPDDSARSPKSLERAAADAFSQGNLPLAVQLYDRLAREHPENPAFEKAARIVRDRLDAGR